MSEQAMYRQKAHYYDLIYSYKDYKKESQQLLKILKTNQKSKGEDLLDIGCGTGQHLIYLRKSYNCIGTDVNAPMLAIAKKRNPGMKFITQDMRKLKVNKNFDAIVSLFSAIGYVPRPHLATTIRRMSDHLKPGGVLVIDPWIEPAEWRKGASHAQLYNGKGISLARVNSTSRKGNTSIMEFHWLVAPYGKKVTSFTERHTTYLVPHSEILAMMRENGLKAKKIPLMRGLLVGVKA